MAKIVLDNVVSGYNLDKINANFVKIATALNDLVLYRNNPVGEPNQLLSDLDVNNKRLYNVGDLDVTGSFTANGINFDEVNSALVWRGVWDSLTAYAISDAVSYNGSSFICTVANTGNTPPSVHWQVLAEKGANGTGSGDVSGPASSIASRVATFTDGTGKTIGDSGFAIADFLLDTDLNVSVQAYDVDTAKLDTAQTWAATQRTNETTDNDGSFDLNAAIDFKCTPAALFTLTFTNIPATPLVQKGTIMLVNTGGYAVSAHANTKVGASTLASLSAAGTYELAYRTSNGLVYVTVSGALA
jgi:hypothetical protein